MEPEQAYLLDRLLKEAGVTSFSASPSDLPRILKEWKLWGSQDTNTLNTFDPKSERPKDPLEGLFWDAHQSDIAKLMETSQKQREVMAKLFPKGMIGYRYGVNPEYASPRRRYLGWHADPELAVRRTSGFDNTIKRGLYRALFQPEDVAVFSSSLSEPEFIVRNDPRFVDRFFISPDKYEKAAKLARRIKAQTPETFLKIIMHLGKHK